MSYFGIADYAHEHNFVHLQYVGWPDFGAPQCTTQIITLVKTVRKLVAEKEKNVKILVHCSAGVGRSGTFISLYELMQILDSTISEYKQLERFIPVKTKDIEETSIDIFKTVFNLRKQRCEMVCIL